MKKQEKELLQELVKKLEDINEMEESINHLYQCLGFSRERVEELKEKLGVE